MTDPNTVFARSFVAGLEAAGVVHACIAPGSRNTPLSLAIADSGISETSHHDERSASFFAIGIAKQTGAAVAVVTTSGTAATELHPAIAEADAAAVPIIALTADRPTELIGRSAPQTIDQRHLFGSMVRWYVDSDVDRETADTAEAMGEAAVRASLGAAPGPVHCNLRFREPLVIAGRAQPVEVTPLHRQPIHPSPDALATAWQSLDSDRGVIVVGPQTWREGVSEIAALGRAWGWPVMADPLSGLRAGLDDVDGVVGSDLLAAPGWLEMASPQAVLRFGTPATSKALNTWLTDHAAIPQVVVAPWGHPDPGGSASSIVRGDAGMTAAALRKQTPDIDPSWLEKWREAHEAAIAAATESIAVTPFPSEPAVAATIARLVQSGSTLWVGSSMPIRDVDSYFPVTTRRIAIHGHRGANGIDGLVSAALGSASTGVPTVALTGDVAMLHDVGALATMARTSIPLTVVVVNNDGGGIFHFLPQAGHPHFEKHFGTPHGMSFAAIARGFGIEAITPEDQAQFEQAISTPPGGPRLIEIKTDRTTNLSVHRSIADAVKSSLAAK